MALQRPSPFTSSPLRRVESTITIAIFVTVFATASRLARLPLRALLKDDLALPPEAMAEFFAIIGLAWYLKPFAGVLSDQIPLAGTRRKHYLVVSASAGALTWILAAILPLRFESLLVAMMLVNVAAVLGNSVAGGLLVNVGRDQGATGRLSSLRVVAMNAASLTAGPLGGWLAARSFPLTCTVATALMLFMAAFVALVLQPDAPTQIPERVMARLRDVLSKCKERRIWAVALYTGALYLTPSYQSLFYYFQRDQLEFTDQIIGLFGALNCLGGMLGALVYYRLSSHLRLGRALVLGTLLCGLCSLAYLLYDSSSTALVLEPIAGFCFVLGIMPIHELTARASPPAHEAFGFAIILSIGNLAIATSDVIGTHLAAAYSLDVRQLIIVNAASVVATLVLLPVVPRALLGREGVTE